MRQGLKNIMRQGLKLLALIPKPHIYREQDSVGGWSWAVKPGGLYFRDQRALRFVTKMNWGWRPGREWR